MRKLSLAVCALSLSLFACKKDSAPETPATAGAGKKVALTVRTKDFLQQVEGIPGSNNKTTGTAGALRDSALAAKVSFINYMLFDGSGNLLHMKTQQADWDQDFGTIYDSIAPGTYTVLLTASQTPLAMNAVDHLADCAFSVPLANQGLIDRTPDIFYSKENVAVTDGTEAMELNATLDRVVGNLQVNILDVPQPSNGDTSASIYITPEAPLFYGGSGLPGFGPIGAVTAKVHRVGVNTFSAYVLNTASAFSVTINYVDLLTGQPKTKVINNVQCYKNRRTILSGYLYGGEPVDSGIKVILLDSWSGDNNEIAF